MLKNYRIPLAALFIAVVLLGLALAGRPVADLPPVPTAAVTMVTATPAPVTVVAFTPAPTVPYKTLDVHTLNEALIGSPKKINPLFDLYNQVDRDIASLIFQGLYQTDAYGESVPVLAAAKPEISYDGLEYVVPLRTDVLWQDGKPFTADDVLFTINLMRAPDFSGPAELHDYWKAIEVEKLDAQTVRFRLVQPLAAFPEALRVGILPQHALQGITAAQLASHPFNLSPIGTGPYQFDSWVGDGTSLTGVRLKLAATYRQRPEGKTGFDLDQIVFHFYPSYHAAVDAFQNGEVTTISDLSSQTLTEISAITELRLYFQYRPAFGAIIYNWKNTNTAFFRNVQFRQALAQAVDRTSLISTYLPGRALPASSPILPDSWASSPNVACDTLNAFDMTQAKQTLQTALGEQIIAAATAAPTANAKATAAATAPAASSPTSLQFNLLVSNDPSLVGMAQAVLKNWNALGVPAKIVVTDAASFSARLSKGDFDAALVELNLAPSADPDPYTLWRQPPADGGLNFGGMNDRQLNNLVEEARRTSQNGVARGKLYHDYQLAFCQSVPALILYNPIYVYSADTRLKGIQLGFIAEPSDRFRTIQDWHFSDQPD